MGFLSSSNYSARFRGRQRSTRICKNDGSRGNAGNPAISAALLDSKLTVYETADTALDTALADAVAGAYCWIVITNGGSAMERFSVPTKRPRNIATAS